MEDTQEKRTEDKLRFASILTRNIVDAVIGTDTFDNSYRILSWNKGAEKLYGWTAEEVMGKPAKEVVPTNLSDEQKNELIHALERKGHWAGEVIQKHKNGKPIYVHASISLVHNDEGIEIGAVAVNRDISERKIAEEHMRLNEEKYRQLSATLDEKVKLRTEQLNDLNQVLQENNQKLAAARIELEKKNKQLNEAQQIAHIGSWEWNLESSELTWSDNLYSIYGVDRSGEISFETFSSLLHPDDKERVLKMISEAAQGKPFNDFYHRIITGAGETRYVYSRGETVKDDKGKVIRMMGTGQDVTDQKKTEQQLIETNRKFEERNRFVEKLINSSLDLVMVIDKELRFVTINKKAESIIREIYQGEIIGEKILHINPAVERTQSHYDLIDALEGKIIIRDNVQSTVPGGRMYEHNYVPLFDEQNKVYAVMVISHDITEKISQMEELKKLSETDVQKSNFIAMASHELKTPITSIKGYVQLLLNAFEKEKETEKPLPPLLVRSSLLSVDKQITRLTRLISELLDLTKIETGTLELKKEEFMFNELAIETVEDILYTNSSHQINIFHDFHSRVYADRDRIGQVMINFLTNAIKYSPKTDRINVTIHRHEKDQIAFTVEDFGIGIEESEQSKILERFYRAKGKEEQTYPGFGIGLFIANEFVQKHGGKLMVNSKKGRGSVFTFTLPIIQPQS